MASWMAGIRSALPAPTSIGKYDLFAERMAEAFDARPVDEPVWESLRRVFDITLEYLEPTDPRPASVVGAAFACVQAARLAHLASDRGEPFARYLDDAMAAVRRDEVI